MERIDIAADGDLVLVVRNELELRVHSIVLTIASPVFKAMLGPNFAEGQAQGSATDPKMLPLPEDEPVGMKLLCFILYGHLLQNTPPVQHIVQLGKAADKYQCMRQAALPMEAWVARFYISQQKDADKLATLHAVYLLNDARYFDHFTTQLVRNGCKLSHPQHLEDDIEMKILYAVNSKISLVRNILGGGVDEAVDHLCRGNARGHYCDNEDGMEPPRRDPDDIFGTDDYCDFQFDGKDQVPPKCDYNQRYVWLHLESLAKAQLWPPSLRRSRLSDLREDILAFEVALLDFSIKPCLQAERCNANQDPHYDFDRAIIALQKKVEYVDFALCFTCFKSASVAGKTFDGECVC